MPYIYRKQITCQTKSSADSFFDIQSGPQDGKSQFPGAPGTRPLELEKPQRIFSVHVCGPLGRQIVFNLWRAVVADIFAGSIWRLVRQKIGPDAEACQFMYNNICC